MTYIIGMSIVADAKAKHEEDVTAEDCEKSQAWFEGYVHGLRKARAIDDEELNYIIEILSSIFDSKDYEERC